MSKTTDRFALFNPGNSYISFLPDTAPSAWEEERRACLIACQAAVLEHMAALRKHNAV